MYSRLPLSICAITLVVIVSTQAATGSDTDLDKLRADANNGNVLAEIELAARYISGNGLSRDPALAAHWYEKAAQQGNADAANEIGYFYQKGIGVTPDLSRAIRWYQLAAAGGSSFGKLNLGSLYITGFGVKKDIPFAVQLLEDAVAKRNGPAAAYLGDIYALGLLGTPDLNQAEKWYQMGIKLDDAISEFDLGTLYSVQPGHSRDLPRAAELLRRSANHRYVPAMHSLGILLVRQPELRQSQDEAQTMVETAASHGSWRSSVLLGIFARDGRPGAPADKKQALFHFDVAQLQGGEEAEKLLRYDVRTLSSTLTPQEREEIDATAHDWYSRHRELQSEFSPDPVTAKYFPYLPSPSAPPSMTNTFVQWATIQVRPIATQFRSQPVSQSIAVICDE